MRIQENLVGDRVCERHAGHGVRRIVKADDFAVARNSGGKGEKQLSDRGSPACDGNTECRRNDFRQQRREDVRLGGVTARERGRISLGFMRQPVGCAAKFSYVPGG